MYYLQFLVNGIIAGSVYALFAVGLTMVYGVFRFINFAHGELIAWGAYGVLFFTLWLDWPFPSAVALSVLLTVIIGLISDRVVYQPLHRRDRIYLLIASIGLSFFLRNALVFVFGSDLISYELELIPSIELGGIFFSVIQAAMVVTALVFLGGLYVLLTRTLLGKAFRAVSDNPELAGIMGLPMKKVNRIVWILASIFAAAGGVLLAMDTSLEPHMGLVNLVKAFAAVLLGGAGNVWGALLGGLIIGVAENMSVAFLSPGYKDFMAFAVILVMLLFRPQGIFALKSGVR